MIEVEDAFGAARFTHASCPTLVRLHGPWFLVGEKLGFAAEPRFRRRVGLEAAGIYSAAGVTAPSRDILKATIEYYGSELPNVAVIPNPIDPVPCAARWRACEAKPNQLLFVGRFNLVKGGDVVLRAFQRVLRQCPDARLLFAGPDDGVVDEARATLNIAEFVQKYCAAVTPRLCYLGSQTAQQLAELRRQSALAIVCSRYEVFGYTALEAMALGVPVVASRVGGLAEIIESGRTGLLCRPGDPESLADAVLRLLREPELGARVGEAAAKHVEEHYQPSLIARQTVEFYKEAIARWGGVHGGM